MMAWSRLPSRSRLRTSAATTRVISAMVATNDSSTSSEWVGGRTANAPNPRIVPPTAIAMSTTTAVAASRRPKRMAAQSSGGIARNVSG